MPSFAKISKWIISHEHSQTKIQSYDKQFVDFINCVFSLFAMTQ